MQNAHLGPNADLQALSEYLDLVCGPIDRLAPVEAEPERININSASAAQLTELLGIGPVLAERIVQARPFNTFEDLIQAKGIGSSKLEALRDLVSW
ncbi:MAG: helix-hairpin-helix domain-containing protein [Synechococcaceae cyanobacterium SM2_3_1]|nr:helix-hairpin-helix domain-containing protein [Synechococcaceae cyanobacterium SM2_3_1]